MRWKEYYEKHSITAREAAGLIESGHNVVCGHACAAPETLTETLVQRADELHAVNICHLIGMGSCAYCMPEFQQTFRLNTLFCSGVTRPAVGEGRADFTPCFFSEVPELFASGQYPVDVTLITVSEPDKAGNVSLGVSIDYTKQAALSARMVIAEVTPHMPRTHGQSFLHVSEIDYFVRTERQIIEMQPPAIGEIEKAIGHNIAGMIKDGDCLQLGIGAIPDATLTFLDDKKDLGIHSEMISDGVMHLAEKGVTNGSRKNLHPGKIVITFAMGTRKFYDWLDDNTSIEVYPVDYTNDPFIIAQNDNMVSINSCLAVDLSGQVAADSLDHRPFSGVGGQVDFVRGAKRSKGGRSIIAMPSTARSGTASRIVATLAPGQAVTTSRNDVDHIVTEYGVASLHGKTMLQRAEELINIAHPDFRDELRQSVMETYSLY